MTEPAAPSGPALPDGTYDVFVVDATEVDAGTDAASRVVHLELTIVSGEQKGEVLGVSARGLAGEEFELLGMPATLTVADGIPTVRIDS